MIRLFEKKKFVAIDYDRQAVRLVVFEYVRNAPIIRSVHAEPVDEGVDVTDPQAMGACLRAVVDRLHLRGAGALMCIGRAHAVLKSFQLPAVTSTDELASMVQFQASKELPFAAHEAVVDFTHAEHFDVAEPDTAEEGTNVLAAAVRLPVIDAARQICAEASLKLRRLGLRPYANLRAVYHSIRCQPHERILLVSITADEVEIDVMRDEMLEFSRAATITSPPDEQAQGDTNEAIVRRAVMEVSRSLQSFLAMQRGGEINACLVAGGTGMEEEICQALAKRLKVPCELFDPSGPFGLARGQEACAFGAALGLAAGQAADALPFDFINPKQPAPPRDTRRTRALAIAAGAVLLVALLALARYAYLGGRGREVANLERDKRSLQARNKALKKLAKQTAAIEEWQGADINWLDQLAHLSNTMPGPEKLYLTSLRCSASNVIALGGRVRDNRDIAGFAAEQMERAGYKVDPKGTSPVRDHYGYGLQFNLDIRVSPKAEPVVQTEKVIGRPGDDSAGRGTEPTQQPNRGGSSRRTGRSRPDRRRRTR